MDFKKHIFDRKESELRGKILNDSVKVELAVNIIIKSAFGVSSKVTHSFDKSSSLSFAQKINLLNDLGIIDNESYKLKFITYAQIRNEFAHKFQVQSIDSCNKEIGKFLNKYYGHPNDVPFKRYELLLEDIQHYLVSLSTRLEAKGDQIILAEYHKTFNDLLWKNIRESSNDNFKRLFDEIYKKTKADFEGLDLSPFYGTKSLI